MLFSNRITKMDNTIRGAAHTMDAAVRGAANSMDSTLRGAANTAASVAKDAAKDVAASTFPRATEFTLEYLAKVSRRFQRIYSIYLCVLCSVFCKSLTHSFRHPIATNIRNHLFFDGWPLLGTN